MGHLERFEDLVSAIKANGVSEDYLFCNLFKYSLAGEASGWLKQLPPESLTSWTDIKNAFMRNLFDELRAEDSRSKIATFTRSLQSHSEAHGSDSSPIRENVHTKDSTKCSYSALSSEASHWHIRWLWTQLVKEISTPGIQRKL